MSNSSSTASSFITTVAAFATVAAVGIPLIQTDTVSRFLLSPKALQAKRQASYRYKWNWTLIKAIIRNRGGRDQGHDKSVTELFLKDEEVAQFVKEQLLKQGEYRIVSIELDDEDPRATREYFIFLKDQSGNLYQLPLVLFGEILAQLMEDQITTTALAFLADASSGWSSEVLSTILTESKCGVAVIREPLWMALLADITEKQLITRSKLERILFGLCRLEAWRVREQIGSARTVAFTLPGQACTPALLPLLQAVFPCERHMFAYDKCVNSVKRALHWRKQPGASFLDSFYNPITATTPMTSSLTRSIRELDKALAQLPLNVADTTEAWMSSVDAFFKMKADEAKNEYLPYVLKMDLIMDGSLDDLNSDRRLALTNVLQFVTGSRSRPLPEGVLDAAAEALRDLQSPALPSLSKDQLKGIENCAFCHKSILIQDKTLMDTVMPQKEWTLKSARKISGCLCCGPDEYGDEDEEEGNDTKPDLNVPGAFATNRPKYMDGKSGFAFDPTQFS